jgi:hypothetical protein
MNIQQLEVRRHRLMKASWLHRAKQHWTLEHMYFVRSCDVSVKILNTLLGR